MIGSNICCYRRYTKFQSSTKYTEGGQNITSSNKLLKTGRWQFCGIYRIYNTAFYWVWFHPLQQKAEPSIRVSLEGEAISLPISGHSTQRRKLMEERSREYNKMLRQVTGAISFEYFFPLQNLNISIQVMCTCIPNYINYDTFLYTWNKRVNIKKKNGTLIFKDFHYST